jgi:hypothetical protein
MSADVVITDLILMTISWAYMRLISEILVVWSPSKIPPSVYRSKFSFNSWILNLVYLASVGKAVTQLAAMRHNQPIF